MYSRHEVKREILSHEQHLIFLHFQSIVEWSLFDLFVDLGLDDLIHPVVVLLEVPFPCLISNLLHEFLLAPLCILQCDFLYHQELPWTYLVLVVELVQDPE